MQFKPNSDKQQIDHPIAQTQSPPQIEQVSTQIHHSSSSLSSSLSEEHSTQDPAHEEEAEPLTSDSKVHSSPPESVTESLQQNKPKIKLNKIEDKKLPYQQISDIPELDSQSLSTHEFGKDDYVLLVADLPYNKQFQEELLGKIRNILKKRNSTEGLQIYRVDTKDEEVKQVLSSKFNASTNEETIFMLKHPFDNYLSSINFDMVVRSPQILPVFLSDLAIVRDRGQLEDKIQAMSPYQSYLVYIVDEKSAEDSQTLLSAKYIEMELEIQHLENIKLLILTPEAAQHSQLFSNPKPKTMQVVRKSNEFTYRPPNRFLNGVPLHVIENFSLFDKKREMTIQKQLSRIETFSSASIESPFVCSLTIDRNKTSPQEERAILKLFARLKQQQLFPTVSFIIKFGEVQYRGKQEDPFAHRRWSVMMANVDELTKETMLHEIKAHEEGKKLGITESTWQKNTYEFLYREPELNEHSLSDFIQRTVEGMEPFFCKSEQKTKMQKLNKVTGENFNEQVIGDKSRSHWVFEYSDYCASCAMLGPIIEKFSEVVELFPDLKSRVHGLNCDRNRVRGQPYSPYTPNLYYYSRNWGNQWPLRYPLLEWIGELGIKGLYDFSEITESLGRVDEQKLNEHLRVTQQYSDILNEL